MIKTEELSTSQWQSAHQIAIQLAKGTDVNEFRKAIAYLKTISDRADAGKKFISYLNALARNGDKIGHSKKTKGYYKSILDICETNIVAYLDDADAMLQILGWSARLIKYYQNNPVAEDFDPSVPTEPEISQRQVELAKEIAKNDFAEGQIVDAVVAAKSDTGKKVTYTIANTSIKLTKKEPKEKIFKSLEEGAQVRVEIIKLDEGKIKKIKLVS